MTSPESTPDLQALLAENAALRDQVAGRVRMAQLLGRSRSMQRVFEIVGKIHSTGLAGEAQANFLGSGAAYGERQAEIAAWLARLPAGG